MVRQRHERWDGKGGRSRRSLNRVPKRQGMFCAGHAARKPDYGTRISLVSGKKDTEITRHRRPKPTATSGVAPLNHASPQTLAKRSDQTKVSRALGRGLGAPSATRSFA
jgi:hypothetical protein